MRDCWLLGLPGPAHYCRLPLRGPNKGHTVWSSRPRAAAEAVLGLAAALLDCGQTVALVPPLPRPWTASWVAAGWDEDAATTREREPALWAAAHPGDDAALALQATVLPPGERSDDRWALVLAGHARDPERADWTAAGSERLAPLLDPAQVELIPAPVWPRGWHDPGSAAHLHLRSPDHAVGLHCFAHQRAFGMPAQYLPRRMPARADAEAQRAVARRGGLVAGRSLFVRQLWSASDRGCEYLDHLASAGPGLSLWHPDVVADLPQLLGAIEGQLPGHRCRVIDRRRVSASEAQRRGLASGLLVDADGGRHYLVPTAATRGGGSSFLDQLPATVVPLEWDTAWLGGGPRRCALCLPQAGSEILQAGAAVTGERLAQLRAWVAAHHPAELLPDQVLDPARDDSHRAALAELGGILPGVLAC